MIQIGSGLIEHRKDLITPKPLDLDRRRFLAGSAATAIAPTLPALGPVFLPAQAQAGLGFLTFLALLVSGLQATAQATKDIKDIVAKLSPKGDNAKVDRVEKDIGQYFAQAGRPDGIVFFINPLDGPWLPQCQFYRSGAIAETDVPERLRAAELGFTDYVATLRVDKPLRPKEYRIYGIEHAAGKKARAGAFYATLIETDSRVQGSAQLLKGSAG